MSDGYYCRTYDPYAPEDWMRVWENDVESAAKAFTRWHNDEDRLVEVRAAGSWDAVVVDVKFTLLCTTTIRSNNHD